ncbi:(deoxy)nucleoside triphosphate pyrophosphohydrolase [Anaeromicropila herbilytica]|uniref:(deoxy)nucleoside triphosphate pyrophosphohydrolase n=1 Tax=Anaeromicropila herbilytica TaxID=2785025 RepID=UPI00232A238D|nr:(deoxy)nucleoside triphosphate pyrophosphohydrolase [Anaeromicropila herbilytica]
MNLFKSIEVVAAVIKGVGSNKGKIFAAQRGYGDFQGGWEFPGGKMETGESTEEALIREIREELDSEITVGDILCTVNYDYPTFHLTMHVYWCDLVSGKLELLEHESAKWLGKENLKSVNWLPADIEVIDRIELTYYSI